MLGNVMTMSMAAAKAVLESQLKQANFEQHNALIDLQAAIDAAEGGAK